ncbi:MAG: Flp pilus assembly complex ATPase component TadA [Planctomycetota bacterium]|nr:Flp pilus assembly complex ATPase component TadA [Planctomycetota bacterium]
MASLLVRDTKNGRVKEVDLAKRRFTVGRSDWNDLVLPRDSVSREHCVVFEKDGAFFVRDLGSRAGTIVDGQPITGDVALKDGVRFEVGEFECQFRGQRQRTGAEDERKGSGAAGPEGGSRAEVRAISAAGGPAEALREAKKLVHQLLLEAKELKRIDFESTPGPEARRMTERVAVQVIKDLEDQGKLPTANIDRRRLLKEVLDEALGLGPLEELLADDAISEIMVNRWDQIFVERRGVGMVLAPVQFTSNEQVMHVIRRIVAPIGRRVNEQTPLVDGRLADGSRINAIIPPLAVSGPSLTIRKFPKDRLGVQDLVKFGSLTQEMGKFLEIAVRERLNICISGGTGSGKTTLLNVVSSFIGAHERIVTVEDVSELRLPQDHVVTLETRPANLEGQGAIHIRDLVKNCLRMRPDRIVVGECRGGEALDMLQAMNTGHDGSLTTIHSNSPRDCIARLETLVLMAGMDLPSRAIREQIASAVHLIIQQSRLHDGSRKVTAISEVTGIESGVVTLQDVFLFQQTGFDEKHKVIGHHDATGNVPKFVQALKRRGIDVDLSIFQRKQAADDGPRRRRG